MQLENAPAAPLGFKRRWYHELTRYHWFVLVVAALGWMFDTMDQQLFTLARKSAMAELLAPSTGAAPSDAAVAAYSGYATSIFLIGWASGGLAFGVLGDRIGRVKTMVLTILMYSVCTGLSAISVGFWDFAFYRFLTGIGVGGEFAVGVSLVAEVMPDKARPFALGLLQALSGVGNISAALISMGLGQLQESGAHLTPWRVMFVVGTLPALVAVMIQRRLKEPEKWKAAAASAEVSKRGSYRELFGNPRWRRNAIVGMILASSGVIGLWAIGFFSNDLTQFVFRKPFEAEERATGAGKLDRGFVVAAVHDPAAVAKLDPPVSPRDLLDPEPGYKDGETIFATLLYLQKHEKPVSTESILEVLDRDETPWVADAPARHGQSAEAHARRANYLAGAGPATGSIDFQKDSQRIADRAKRINGRLTYWAGINSIMLNLGAMLGIYAFAHLTSIFGRKPTFALFFLLAMFSTAAVFWFLDDLSQIFWMVPIMGFCQLALFGGYAIYFPELFPTYLRSTGTSFCYNVGRYVAALGPTALGLLTSQVYAGYAQPMRPAGVTMCSVFLIGLLALPFAPETKGKPLPE
jgi:MFS family permease